MINSDHKNTTFSQYHKLILNSQSKKILNQKKACPPVQPLLILKFTPQRTNFTQKHTISAL